MRQSTSNTRAGVKPHYCDHDSRAVMFCETKYNNCKRFQFDNNTDSHYWLEFYVVSSKDIPTFRHAYQTIRQRKSDATVCNYNLCNECCHFLIKKENDFTYLWRSVYWHLLSSLYSSTFESLRRYFEIYSGEHLWELIPITMRGWWINTIKGFFYRTEYPYSECTINYPPSIFIDKTNQLQEFEEDVNVGELQG